MATAPTPRRGEIWLLDFDPSVGAEIRKVRPALVIGLDAIGRLPLRLVVPITDLETAHMPTSPGFVLLPATATNGLIKDSGADAFQTKSMSEARFVRPLGVVTAARARMLSPPRSHCAWAHLKGTAHFPPFPLAPPRLGSIFIRAAAVAPSDAGCLPLKYP